MQQEKLLLIKNYYSHWLPTFLKVGGITFNKRIYYSWDNPPDWLRRHEQKHVEQFQKEGVIKYFIKYLYEYFKNRIKGMNHKTAYFNISYETEAREAEKNM